MFTSNLTVMMTADVDAKGRLSQLFFTQLAGPPLPRMHKLL